MSAFILAQKDPDEKLSSRREVNGEEICESVKLCKGMRSICNKVKRVERGFYMAARTHGEEWQRRKVL